MALSEPPHKFPITFRASENRGNEAAAAKKWVSVHGSVIPGAEQSISQRHRSIE